MNTTRGFVFCIGAMMVFLISVMAAITANAEPTFSVMLTIGAASYVAGVVSQLGYDLYTKEI